jgi:hypothetical protein
MELVNVGASPQAFGEFIASEITKRRQAIRGAASSGCSR